MASKLDILEKNVNRRIALMKMFEHCYIIEVRKKINIRFVNAFMRLKDLQNA